MFSRLKKSLTGKSFRIKKKQKSPYFTVSQDTLHTRQHEHKIFHDVRDFLEDFDVKSNLSSCQSEIMESQRRKKKARKARLKSLFKSSKAEDRNMMCNDPWSCTRSISMVWCNGVKHRVYICNHQFIFSKFLQREVASSYRQARRKPES